MKRFIFIFLLIFIYTASVASSPKTISWLEQKTKNLVKSTSKKYAISLGINLGLMLCGCQKIPCPMPFCMPTNCTDACCSCLPNLADQPICSAICGTNCFLGTLYGTAAVSLAAIYGLILAFKKDTNLSTVKEKTGTEHKDCDTKQGEAYDICKCENIDNGTYVPLGPNHTSIVNYICFKDGDACDILKNFNDLAYKECVCEENFWTWDSEAKKCIEDGEYIIPDAEISSNASNFNIDTDLNEVTESNDDQGSSNSTSLSKGASKSSSGNLSSLKGLKYKDKNEAGSKAIENNNLSPSGNSFLQNKNLNKKEKEAYNSSFLRAQARKDILKETDDLFENITKGYTRYQLTFDMIQK